MKKNKAVIKHFIKDNQFDLNQYVKSLIKQMNSHSREAYKECKTKEVN